MTLGALLDLGVDPQVVTDALDALGIAELSITLERVHRGGLSALHVQGPTEGPAEPARTWRDIRRLLEGSALAPLVRERALLTFAKLAEAEAEVHGVDVEAVHFHEVGGLDALADIVGVAAVMTHLEPASVSASASCPCPRRPPWPCSRASPWCRGPRGQGSWSPPPARRCCAPTRSASAGRRP
jgi:hypothetical protein